MSVKAQLGKNRIVQVAAVIVVAFAWLLLPSVYTFFASLFILWAVFRLDSRIIAGVTLFFLILIPLLLATNHQSNAENIAVYVFFLLAITVSLQILELMRSPSQVQIVKHIGVSDMVAIHDLKPKNLQRARMDGIIPRHLKA